MSFKKVLIKTTQSRSQARRGAPPDEDNDRIQEEESHNATAPPLQEQDQ